MLGSLQPDNFRNLPDEMSGEPDERDFDFNQNNMGDENDPNFTN